MDPISATILLAAAGGAPAEYVGSYRFYLSARQYDTSTADWVVPATVKFIWVKAWGAGGSNDAFVNSFPGSDGGGGGYARALISVTPGETLKVAVGFRNNNSGGNNMLTPPSGEGGGFSGVLRGSTPLVLAGGGGGGGYNTSSARGGAGGGTAGQDSVGNPGALGGTQTTGTVFGTRAANGGGGGYFSGGGGGGNQYGGGGGSGYVGGGSFGVLTTGNAINPAETSDPDFIGGYATGGSGNNSGVYNSTGGIVWLHCWTGNPGNNPNPSPRTIIATY